jgi:hypothetical protein
VDARIMATMWVNRVVIASYKVDDRERSYS